MASVWQRLGEIVGSASGRTGMVGSLVNFFDPDSWLPGGRDAAFTLALIALSAKMAVSDGVVTASEMRAFKRTVDIPPAIEHQVDRVFQLAQQVGLDAAGYFSLNMGDVLRIVAAKRVRTLDIHTLGSSLSRGCTLSGLIQPLGILCVQELTKRDYRTWRTMT